MSAKIETQFNFNYEALCEITENKLSAAFLEQFQTPNKVVALLHSSEETGLIGVIDPDSSHPLQNSADIEHARRRELFGTNTLPPVKGKNIFQLMWLALQDRILLLLCAAALVSLAVGLYQDLKPAEGSKVDAEPKLHWVEGVAIIIAISIVVLASSINDYQKVPFISASLDDKEKQFRSLNAKKEDRKVKVLRDHHVKQISIYHILVGDILLLEPGDVTSADGILVSFMNLKMDESAATGESDMIKKTLQKDCFILSGSKVNEGIGKYVVTAVGEKSFFGKTMMALRTESEDTPLQIKLDLLAEKIAKLGLSAAIIMFIALILKYVINIATTTGFGGGESQENTAEIIQQIVTIFISAVTIVVVAVPEGLPLAVTLALAYATRRMMDDNNLVRVLSACETMGGATTICSDKTGTLTQNRMTVVQGVFAKSIVFTSQKEVADLSKRVDDLALKTAPSKEYTSVNQVPIKIVLNILLESIAMNSSAFEETTINNTTEFVGSKTEVALLEFSKSYGCDYGAIRKDTNIKTVQIYPFSSERKTMATLLNVSCHSNSNPHGSSIYRIHVKGASEIVLALCDRLVVTTHDTTSIVPLVGPFVTMYKGVINAFAEDALRTICIAYKDITEEDFKNWLQGPIRGIVLKAKRDEKVHSKRQSTPHDSLIQALSSENFSNIEDDFVTDEDIISHPEGMKDLCKNLVCLGVVGIEDPLREGVKEAVRTCQKAGVIVRMVTGDNIVTAKSIATKCGIYFEGGTVMEGSVFRKLSEAEMDAMLPRLQVLARSSPTDKQLLVGRLKALGETVAVTGDGTNDGPALKMADIGFSMGITGTEVAKEASSIILMDDNFASIVKAMMWGRCVTDSVKKFLQFQLTVNVTAVTIAFVTSIADNNESSVLTAVQLLWVNLIMDTLAALALATDPPLPEILDRPPENKKAPLISFYMWKMIIFQSILQITIGLALFFSGPALFRLELLNAAGGFIKVDADITGNPPLKQERLVMRTIIFNTFVFLQVFNQINCRVIDSKLNVLKGITKNTFFLPITTLIITSQIILVFFGSEAFKTTPLNGAQWAACVLLGFLSLPWGLVVRILPDDLFYIFRRSSDDEILPVEALPMYQADRIAPIDQAQPASQAKERWHRAIRSVQTDLRTFKALRGDGRYDRKNSGSSLRINLKTPSLTSIHIDGGGDIQSPKSIISHGFDTIKSVKSIEKI